MNIDVRCGECNPKESVMVKITEGVFVCSNCNIKVKVRVEL